MADGDNHPNGDPGTFVAEYPANAVTLSDQTIQNLVDLDPDNRTQAQALIDVLDLTNPANADLNAALLALPGHDDDADGIIDAAHDWASGGI